MPTLHLLFNHTLTSIQEDSAHKTLGVKNITYLPKPIQDIWKHIPSDKPTIKTLLYPIYDYLGNSCREGDYILIQGDAGATYLIVQEAFMLKLKPIYATTKRTVVESNKDGKVIKTSIFEHVIYREYGI